MDGMKPINKQEPYAWESNELMKRLGYKDQRSFVRIVEEAVGLMILIGVPYYENIRPVRDATEAKSSKTFHLSRFACYLVVMLADRKKAEVASAQGRFSRKAQKYGISLGDIFELERLKIREELSEASKWLSSMAAKAKVVDFSEFNDAGYLGLYEMRARALHDWRALPQDTGQQEYMGRTELAANLLRITLTEQSIWNRKIEGQGYLEDLHYEVGRGIRQLFKTHTGKFPEKLPVYRDLAAVKKQLKTGYRKMIETPL